MTFLQSFELWWQSDFFVVCELFECNIFCTNDVDLVPDSHVVFVHQLNVLPFLQRIMNYKFLIRPTSYINYLRFFRLQLVFLLDSLDAAARSISAILESSSSLLHSDDLVAIKSTKFEGSIEVSDRD